MNSDPNSDCKQCTESKLGWVHNAHTQGPGCAHALPRLRTRCAQAARTLRPSRAQAARWVPCRCALGAVSWPPLRLCRRSCRSAHWQCCRPCRALCRAPCRLSLVMIQKLYHTANRVTRAAARVVALLHHIARRWALYRSPWRAMCRNIRAALLSRYKPLYRDTP